MEADYEEYDRSKQEFDPFQNVKPSSGSTNGAREPFKGVSHSQQPQRPTAFSRDFLDSLCTVVNRDLLFCKLFYFFFFGAFGSLFPLLAIYFKQLGMNASQSGVLIGFRPFIEFLSSPFWGGLADKWKRGKEMLLFSLVCWIVFTLAIAFVKPPAHKCITFNGTHNLLEVPLGRRRRDDASAIHRFSVDLTPMSVSHLGGFKVLGSDFRLLNPPPLLSKTTTLSVADSIQDPRLAHNSGWAKDVIVLPDDLEVIDINSRYRRSPVVDPSKIANVNGSMRGLIFNRHSTVVYQ
ncbi:hypothetical protein BgiMline_025742, partial [Biomphalaria glabrata]